MKKSIILITFLSLIINNKTSAQKATSLLIDDTRNVNELPNFSTNSIKADFKPRGILGVPGSGYWSVNLTFSPWTNSDNTGGKNYQLNLNEGGLFYRNAYPLDPQWGNWQQIVMADSDGNLGIGTKAPTNLLHLLTDSNIPLKIESTNTEAYINMKASGSDSNYGALLRVFNNNFAIYHGNGVFNSLFINGDNGNIGIGTANPISKLTVAGNIASREVKVTVDAGADFVFENDYSLPSLESVDQFIKENKHLPEIASAKEMKQNGINLSEMNIKLLQKIEEMTLYMIEQNKKITELETRLRKVEKN